MTVGLDERESPGNIPNGEDSFKDSKSKEANLSIEDDTLAPWIADPPPGQHADERLMITGVSRLQNEERSCCDNTVRKILNNVEILSGIIRFREGLESLTRQSPLAIPQPDLHPKPNMEPDRGLLDLALSLALSSNTLDALDILFPDSEVNMESISPITTLEFSTLKISQGEWECDGSGHLTRNQYAVHHVSLFLPRLSNIHTPTSIAVIIQTTKLVYDP
jgi:hypothetical protein